MSVLFRYDFLKFNFSYFTPYASQDNFRRKPKIFGFKNVMERGIRKILTFVKRCSNASKILGKYH